MLKYIRLSPVFFLALLGLIVSLLIACSQTTEDGGKNESDITNRATGPGPSGYGYDGDDPYGGYGYDPYGGYGYGYDYRYDY
jgi:hypothetical protein